MRLSAFLPLLLSVASTLGPVDALKLRIQGRHPSGSRAHLRRRGNISGTTTLNNSANVDYYTNITLGGNQFQVLIDTGSSDLYVTGNVPGNKATGASAKVTYAVGEVQGPIKTAALDFAGYSVNDQAYIEVAQDAANPNGMGLIGLGPTYGSQVHDALNSASGDTVLDRIFRQNTSTPNFITVLLGRSNDPSETFPGDLTVGEVLQGYENITSQPHLPVSHVSVSDQGDQHWQTLLDAGGIIGPAGNALDVDTIVSSTSNKKQLTVVFDTGFSLPQVPSDVAKAIYGDVPNAKLASLDNVGTIWTLPCDKEVNITFKFGGVSYPVHPLDATLDLGNTDSSGNRICVGAFQPISTSTSSYDVILGMAFLRNVYLSINFGDFIDGAPTSQTSDPYLQLLSTTPSPSAAHADFVKSRGASSWTPSSSTGTTLADKVRSHLPLVIGVAAAAGLVVVAGILYCCVFGARRKSGAGFGRGSQGTYRPLDEPAPPEALDLHAMGGGGGGGGAYGPGPYGQARYDTPWDHRF